MTHDCDVLIVGAGPVGTTLALELALHHVSFRIVDQAPVRSNKSRALVVQPRTLELLNRHGASDVLVRRGRSIRGGAAYVKGQLAVNLDFDDLGVTDTEFVLPLNISQAETECFLDDCLSKYNIVIERPFTATQIVQDDNGVNTTLKSSDGKTIYVRSKYVVGCDGAHSLVRKTAKTLKFEGAAYPHDFLLCDVHLHDSNLPQDRVSLFLNPKGVLALFPLSDKTIRIVASGDGVIPKDQEEPTLEQFQSYFSAVTQPGSGTLRDPVWISRFRLHHRCVNHYREGRLFLAGDAAHIHSPAGGQGMNAGMQDAINLGWKLALALKYLRDADDAGGKDASAARARARADALLDTYDAERRPVGYALLKGTDRVFTFTSSTNPFFHLIRDFLVRYIFPFVVRNKQRRLGFYQFMSEFGVTYRGCSPIVGTAQGFRGPVQGGDRLPDGKLRKTTTKSVSEGGDEGGKETTLHRVCVGGAHHFMIFAGSGDDDVWEESKLVAAGETVVKAFKSDVELHFIQAETSLVGSGDEWFTDPEGKLHTQFGFTRPAYVLVRPDGYVAHIGPLAQLQQLISFLE